MRMCPVLGARDRTIGQHLTKEETAMKEKKAKKRKKVVLKDLEVRKAKGGVAEADPKGGPGGRKVQFPVDIQGTGPMRPTGVRLGEGFKKY